MKGFFRHDINLHHIAFAAVAVVIHDAIRNGQPLTQVDYTDNLDVSHVKELVDKDSDIEGGQDCSNEEEEHDDSTAQEDTEGEDVPQLLILTIIKKSRL